MERSEKSERIPVEAFITPLQPLIQAFYNSWLELQDVLPKPIHHLDDLFYKTTNIEPAEINRNYSYGFVRRSAKGNFRLLFYGDGPNFIRYELICDGVIGQENVFNFWSHEDLTAQVVESFHRWERMTYT